MHANTQIPKFIGFERISQLEEAKAYHDAASNFFDNVTTQRSISIGGNSVREHFNPVDDFSSVVSSEQGPESCNTYNMLKLSKLLFEDTSEEHYIDFTSAVCTITFCLLRILMVVLCILRPFDLVIIACIRSRKPVFGVV